MWLVIVPLVKIFRIHNMDSVQYVVLVTDCVISRLPFYFNNIYHYFYVRINILDVDPFHRGLYCDFLFGVYLSEF